MNRMARRQRNMLLSLALVVLGLFFVQTANASTVIVGTCLAGTQYSTIMAAITPALPGTVIKVCPGTYPEQLTINKTLTIEGVSNGTSDQAVIVVPNGGLVANAKDFDNGNSPIDAQILVTGPSDVTLLSLVVDGAGNGVTGCTPDVIGILYQNAQGLLNHITTRNQYIGPEGGSLSGCQSGQGIFAQTDSGNWTLEVENSSVHDFQKNGITGNDAGTTLIVIGSYIVGQGATNGAAENGIQIAFGATGSISGNFVIDDVWGPDVFGDTGDAAAGILLYDTSGSPLVKGNVVGNTQFGIAVVTDTGLPGNTSVQSNKVFGTRLYDGIDVCSNTNTIQANTLVNSAESGIHLDASCGLTGSSNLVESNTIIDACTGVLEDSGTSGNTVTPDTFYVNGTTIGSSCGTGASEVYLGASRRALSQHKGGNFQPVK
jgi:Periplasmic copper-binding protein (NosD)